MSDIEKSSPNGEHMSNGSDHNDPTKQEPNSDFVPPTADEEAKLIRKLDWHLMPTLFILYMLSVLDRSNIGNARIAGMEVSTETTFKA